MCDARRCLALRRGALIGWAFQCKVFHDSLSKNLCDIQLRRFAWQCIPMLGRPLHSSAIQGNDLIQSSI
jgi:hypothetical protein